MVTYHRMAWVEKDSNDHQFSTPLLCAGSPTTRPGCPEPHPAWLWMPPGMGHPQPPWATCSSAPPLFVWKNFFLLSNLNLLCLSLRPFPLVLSLSTLVNSCSPSCICSLQVLEGHNEISPELSLFQAKQAQFPQPFLIGEDASCHLCGSLYKEIVSLSVKSLLWLGIFDTEHCSLELPEGRL